MAVAKHRHHQDSSAQNQSQASDSGKRHHRHHSNDDADADAGSAHARRLAKKRHEERLARQQEQAHEERLAAKKRKAHEQHLAEKQQKAHEARLAAKEEREHRNRLRHMSHADKVALKQHYKRLAAQQAHEHRLALLEKQHEARLAKLQKQHAGRLAAQRQARLHAANLAKLARAHAAQQAHEAKLAAIRQARQRAHEKALAEAAVAHQAAIAQRLAAHNARLAAQKAHYVAMHGDDTSGRSITFSQTVAANVPVKVITVDLNDANVKVSAVMSRNGDGTSEAFPRMIARANPNVAVTGTFFSLDNLKPIGDIVIDGSLVHFGGMGTALCVTNGNHADMVTCQWGRHHDWSPYDFVVACGPRLLRSGRIVLDPHAERFKDRHMLAPNSRIAVGITPGNKLVFAMTREPIYLGRLARAMRALGCREAMNLDAGTSTGFYYNGTTLARPGRKLTNMIVVYGSRARYEHALDQLVPAPYRRYATAHRQASRAGERTPAPSRNPQASARLTSRVP